MQSAATVLQQSHGVPARRELLGARWRNVDRERTNANARRFKRDDAAAFERVDKGRKVRQYRLGQRLRLAATLAAKLNHRRLLTGACGQERPEVRIGGDDNSTFGAARSKIAASSDCCNAISRTCRAS